MQLLQYYYYGGRVELNRRLHLGKYVQLSAVDGN